MGFIKSASIIPQILMKFASSNFLAAATTKLAKFGENMWEFATTVIGFIMEMLYFVCKWALYFVDKNLENVKKPQYKDLFLWKITTDFLAK